MKRFLVVLAALAAVLVAAPAQALHDDMPTMRLATNSVCVIPDFPTVGSGWKVKAAVARWNAAQSAVELHTSRVPGCAVVPVHRYTDSSPERACGSADFQGNQVGADGIITIGTVDIYLNDYCRTDVAWKGRWSKWIIAHELGHAMGLGHTFDQPDSVMCYCYDYSLLNAEIGADDAEALTALYAIPRAVQ